MINIITLTMKNYIEQRCAPSISLHIFEHSIALTPSGICQFGS